jgi:hypothetical protein
MLLNPSDFTAAVLVIAPILRAAELDRLWRRATAIDGARPRLVSLFALSAVSARLAARSAELLDARRDDWAESLLLPIGLRILVQGGVTPERRLVDRAWDRAAQIDDPASWIGQVTTLGRVAALRPSRDTARAFVHRALRLQIPERWYALAGLAPVMSERSQTSALKSLREAGDEDTVIEAAVAGALRAAERGDYFQVGDFLNIGAAPGGRYAPALRAAVWSLPAEALPYVVDRTVDPAALAAIAACAAKHGDLRLTRYTLEKFRFPHDLQAARRQVALHVTPRLARQVLPLLGTQHDGNWAAYLAELMPRLPPAARHRHVEAIVRAAHGRHGLEAESRREVLTCLRRPLGALSTDRLSALWTWTMRETGSANRREILADMAGFAAPLIHVFGDAVAVALDDAITIGAVDSWPGPSQTVRTG